MRWPRKGIVIRALIYGPLIGYLSWSAFCRQPESPEPEAPAKSRTRTITNPDGTQFEVIELSPEEAEKMMGRQIPTPPEAAAELHEQSEPSGPAEGVDSGAERNEPEGASEQGGQKPSQAPNPAGD